MKRFFEEYGGIALAILAVLVLIAIVSPVGKGIKNSLTGVANNFAGKMNSGLEGSEFNVDGTISKKQSFVGYYADVDGDGVVDGVIFADLAVGGSGTWNPSGESWANSAGTYSYGTIPADELKSYRVTQESYNGKFGTKPVLSPEGSGKDRFYVMALENIDTSTYTWYANAYNGGNGLMTDYSTTTSPDFGKGKANTATMINKWNNQAYGPQNTRGGYKDLWGKVSAGSWFVPSKMEWATFAGELGVTKANYSSLGLSGWYWSSSQYSSTHAWFAYFYGGTVNFDGAHHTNYVRLATTF